MERTMATLLQVIFAAGLAVWLAQAPAMAQGWRHVGNVEAVTTLPDGVELTAGPAKVRVTVCRDGVFRVRLAPQGRFARDASWAVVPSADAPKPEIHDHQDEATIALGDVVATIRKSPLLIEFSDRSGNVLLADRPDLSMAWNGTRVRTWKQMPTEEHYFGLGDKAGPVDRRGRAFTNWNTDAYAWQGATDPLYKTIPFFMGLRKGRAYGVFFDNTWRSSFDFGKESEEYYSFGAEGGELNYYFVAGPEPARVIERYTALTGRTPLPPMWALGFQQSRYSYVPESRVRDVAATLRRKRIPADAIYLDIDYQDGYAPFTVDRKQFPRFEDMISDLREQGFRTVLITDLHIKKQLDKGYAPFDSGMREDVFVKNADGSVYTGPVWPGDSVFPDFTLSRVRDWWGGLYRAFVGMGAAGFWNDMNEPSVFRVPGNTMPLDVVHRLDDGSSAGHRAIHNVYGMQNARATYEGLLELQPDERPFVLTRAAYAGTQRYAATWTGDNTASWQHLAMSTPTLLSLGLSGYALAGDDIGGFIGSPSAQLLTRWYQLGAFNPIFRSHAATDTRPHEPWSDGRAHERVRREAIELRYRLLPYLYTAAEENARTGMPIMRPVFLGYPAAEAFYGNDRDFLFGADLFVAPPVSEALDAHRVQLPPGEWYDVRSGRKYADSDGITLPAHPPEVPLFARGGAIIPLQPLVQHTNEQPEGPLQLRLYLPSSGTAQDCRGSLYQDDGHTLGYRQGAYLRIGYTCESAGDDVTLDSTVARRGFSPWWTAADVTIYGLKARPRDVLIDDRRIDRWRYDRKTQSITLTVPDAVRDWKIRVVF